MRFALFAHSWLSDWNHGNAHFLRGLAAELARLGHQVRCYEELAGPHGGWSLAHLLAEPGGAAGVRQFRRSYPELDVRFFQATAARPRAAAAPALFPALAATGVACVADLAAELRDTDCVLLHEWAAPAVAAGLAALRRRAGFRLLWYDTHHRALSQPAALARLPLRDCDAVLAFGESLRRRYERDWGARRSFVLHEAADTRRFRPRAAAPRHDLAWVGNWGDGERSAELREFFLRPAARLGLTARAHGVRYPPAALCELAAAALEYGGYLPNLEAPAAYAAARLALHIPRRAYVQALPGIPTIRVFEALACGAALVCAPWDDCERLFEPGRDYVSTAGGARVSETWTRLLAAPAELRRLGAAGRAAILARHTCAHRARELEAICRELDSTFTCSAQA